MKKRTVTVNDTMQRGYRYQLVDLLAETLIRSSIQG